MTRLPDIELNHITVIDTKEGYLVLAKREIETGVEVFLSPTGEVGSVEKISNNGQFIPENDNWAVGPEVIPSRSFALKEVFGTGLAQTWMEFPPTPVRSLISQSNSYRQVGARLEGETNV